MSLVALSQDALGLADELTPLLLLRTLGLLARQHGVAMPTPFDVNYVPNFLTSCDRLSIERYADIVTRSVLDDFDVVKLESLLKEWYAATHSLTAGGKRKRTQQPALFRSRFTNCKSIDQFCSLIGAFHAATVPDAGPRIVHLWLTAKFGGVSKFTATVLLRELALYVDRLRIPEAVPLGGNQGSAKFLRAHGVTPNAMEGVLDTLRPCIAHRMATALALVSPGLRTALTPLLDRLPTFFDIENFCCEGSKMQKMLGGTYSKKRIFKIGNHPPPRMDATPLCTSSGGIALVDLRISASLAEEARHEMTSLVIALCQHRSAQGQVRQLPDALGADGRAPMAEHELVK